MTDILAKVPVVTYKGRSLSNIMVSARVVHGILAKYRAFHGYNIREQERPDTVAADYYGNSDYTWLVLYSNLIYDPYFEWPLDYRDFLEYLKKKYGYIDQLMNDISHYEYTGTNEDTEETIARISWKMSIKTFNSLDSEQRVGWTPKMVYDYELEQNEARRAIRLLDNQYIPQIEKELINIFNG